MSFAKYQNTKNERPAERTSFTPYYVSKKTTDAQQDFRIPSDEKAYILAAQKNLQDLAVKLFNAAKEAGAVLESEKESKNEPGTTYTSPDRFRISVEPRMKSVKDEAGNYTKEKEPVYSDDGKLVYDSCLSVEHGPERLRLYAGSRTADSADGIKLSYADMTVVSGTQGKDFKMKTYRGISEITDAASEDMKKFMDSISEYLPKEQSLIRSLYWEFHKRFSEVSSLVANKDGKLVNSEYSIYNEPQEYTRSDGTTAMSPESITIGNHSDSQRVTVGLASDGSYFFRLTEPKLSEQGEAVIDPATGKTVYEARFLNSPAEVEAGIKNENVRAILSEAVGELKPQKTQEKEGAEPER